MRWWNRVWKRPDTDAGDEARELRRRVAENQPHVDALSERAERRVRQNHFREAIDDALRRL